MMTSSNTPRIRGATADDAARMRAIARAAYAKYVPRIGREPSPMVADYEAAVAANHAVVIEAAGNILGYMIAWPEADAYFIENIGVDPECQGGGLGRRLIDHAVSQADRLGLPALRLYTNALMSREFGDVRAYRLCRNASLRREGLSSRLFALDPPHGRTINFA